MLIKEVKKKSKKNAQPSVIENLAYAINHTVHSTTNRIPAEIDKSNFREIAAELNKKRVLKSKIDHRKRNQYKLEQPIRIIQRIPFFGKAGENISWSSQIYKIKQILYSIVRYFRVADQEDKLLKETFLDQEIRAVHNPDMYLIEKILRQQGDKLLVKYVNMPSGRDTEWINKRDIL